MLNRDPTQRLGYGGATGAQSIMAHPFFGAINWKDLYEKRIRPPYIPALRGETDFSNFDEEFTKMTPCLSPPAPVQHQGECGTGNCECATLPASLQEQFQGYTFVSSSAGQLMASHLQKTAQADDVVAGRSIPAASPGSQDWFRYAMKRRRSQNNGTQSPYKLETGTQWKDSRHQSSAGEAMDLSGSWQRGRKPRFADADTLDDILEFAMDDV